MDSVHVLASADVQRLCVAYCSKLTVPLLCHVSSGL